MDSEQYTFTDRTISPAFANIAGVILTLVVFGAVLRAYSARWGDNPLAIYTTGGDPLAVLVISLIVFFVSIMIHEGLHALGYRMGGAKWQEIQFGFLWKALTPYAHCTATLRADAYRLAVALPGILLGLIPLAIGFAARIDWLMLYGCAMLAGAIGDVMIFLLLVPLKGDTLIRDHATKPGFQILSKRQQDD